MTSYVDFPDEGGLTLAYNGWNIACFIPKDLVGIGVTSFGLFFADPNGWTLAATIDGPYDDGTWQSIMTAAGGMGAYSTAKAPLIRALIKQHFDAAPVYPVITNQTPYSGLSFNEMLAEYWQLTTPAPNTTWPQFLRK